MRRSSTLLRRSWLVIAGLLIALGGAAHQVWATGNGGQCRLAWIAGNVGTEEEPIWAHFGAECIGPCFTDVDCVLVSLGATVTVGGVEYMLTDCVCAVTDASGQPVRGIDQDDWDLLSGTGPTKCRTLGYWSPVTAQHDGVTCINYNCQTDCMLETVPDDLVLPWQIEPEPGIFVECVHLTCVCGD